MEYMDLEKEADLKDIPIKTKKTQNIISGKALSNNIIASLITNSRTNMEKNNKKNSSNKISVESSTKVEKTNFQNNTSPKNKYSPKKNYITSEEKEQIRKLKEESLFQIEKEKRKFKYLPISSEELDNFSKEVKKNEKILQSELSKKKIMSMIKIRKKKKVMEKKKRKEAEVVIIKIKKILII